MNETCDLTSKHCVPCEGGVPALTEAKVTELLAELKEWQVQPEGKVLYRNYKFKNFYKTMAFVNAVAWIAHQENHHPDIELGFNFCVIKYTTHAIDGLTENDFICAAKVSALEVLP